MTATSHLQTPWAKQAFLVQLARQPLPTSMGVNATTILYAALIVEEAGELLDALAGCISNALGGSLPADGLAGSALDDVGARIASMAPVLESFAGKVRADLAHLHAVYPDFCWTPKEHDDVQRAHIVAVADAFTDLHVVTAGGELSAGIDGELCYQEVFDSNLSKRNPETGWIDTDASGKWIKGRFYKAPNLEAVLFPQLADPS